MPIKKILIIIVALIVIFILAIGGYIAYGLIFPKSPKGSATFNDEDLRLKVSYYQPYKKDRLIFGPEEQDALVPFGKYWRLGANLTTKIKLNQDVSFGGKTLNKGTYGLYTYPYPNKWTLIVSSKSSGSSYNEPAKDKIVLSVDLPTYILETELEQFTIDFVRKDQQILLRFRWDKTGVDVPIEKIK
ncbi:MAG: DUF2911 domain-containing protein [Flavobacteriaceae bacterium]|nr:DUF2911 domain-containing protein [Flavobacteriaceae bacterium]